MIGKRFGLGTVQLGLNYGISNTRGPLSPQVAADILSEASLLGIDLLDTAPNYGNSEAVIGKYGAAGGLPFRVVTKTPLFSAEQVTDQDAHALREACITSCQRLGVERLHGLLLHHVDNFFMPGGEKLIAALEALKADGFVGGVGASVYEGHQIDRLLDVMQPDIIQLPLNLLDQRLIQSGHLVKLKTAGVEVHARSLFLQGLLLMSQDELPGFASAARQSLDLLDQQGVSRLEACLAFGLSVPEIDRIIVGVTTPEELGEIMRAATTACDSGLSFPQFAIDDRVTLNPALWPR